MKVSDQILISFRQAVIGSALALFFPVACPAGDALELHAKFVAPASPFLLGESLGMRAVTLKLTNNADAPLAYVPLAEAVKHSTLRASIVCPSKMRLGRIGDPPAIYRGQLLLLPKGESVEYTFSLRHLGFLQPDQTGRHLVEMSVLLAGNKEAKAAPFPFDVVKVRKADILDSIPIALVGAAAQQPPQDQQSVSIDQIRVSDEIYLCYRRLSSPKDGGNINVTAKVFKLKAKTQLTVEGVFGDRNPLCITFTEPDMKTTHQFLVNSIDGTVEKQTTTTK